MNNNKKEIMKKNERKFMAKQLFFFQ